VYAEVYDAERPELFFKAQGWRVAGHGRPIRIRGDSRWSVPEPELTLVISAAGEIAGFCAGNDVSSRDIEGANPLYLPQAKVYNGSCALGPGIVLCGVDALGDLAVDLLVRRGPCDFQRRDPHVTDQEAAAGAGRLPAP
jgi:2-dehydro-3-deoxy-D-arabinonate dehydratase